MQIWQVVCKNLAIFFIKLLQFVSLCQRLSKKLNFIKIWQVEVGQNKDLVCYMKKQSFRQSAWGLRQLVFKPGFRPKREGFGYEIKVRKFQQPQTNTFLSYVKKTTGGVKFPPPRRNRIKLELYFKITQTFEMCGGKFHKLDIF